MADQIRNFIDGSFVDPTTNEWLENINPANTDEVINRYPASGTEDIDRAVEAAVRAQKEWKKVPAPQRAEVVFEARRLLAERTGEFARALTREEGKVLAEAEGEVQHSLDLLEFLGGEGRRLNGETIPSGADGTFACTVKAPVGVAALITPWNFPVAIPVWKIAPAIIAGNAVVLKPAEQTPTTAHMVTELFVEAGVPEGVVNTVYGVGEKVGAHLVAHDDIDAISFTGSSEVGLQLYAEGAAGNKKVQCEMGGKNAIVVLEDGDVEAAAEAAATGAFGATGQRCTATSRAVVHEDVYDEFVERVVAAAEQVQPGDGLDPESTMGPSVDKRQFQQVLDYMDVAREEGVNFELPAGRYEEGELAGGYFVKPTVLTGVDPEMRVAQEEIFGPVLSVIKVSSFQQALEAANNSDYGLSSAIWTENVGRVFRWVDDIETGVVRINQPTLGGEVQLPFGGIKDTGVGEREKGKPAVEFFTEDKTVYVNYGAVDEQ